MQCSCGGATSDKQSVRTTKGVLMRLDEWAECNSCRRRGPIRTHINRSGKMVRIKRRQP